MSIWESSATWVELGMMTYMRDHGISFIKGPTLYNLRKRDLTFSTRQTQDMYAPVSGTENGELYYTTGKDREIKVSEHFRAGEFARDRTDKFEFARIHPNLVYELEKIRTFFDKEVHIVTGYMEHLHHKNDPNRLDIGINHVAGLAARIKVPGFRGPQLAKFAIITGNKDTSISVGKDDIILAVNQTKQEITSHIGNTDPGRRVRRERAIEPLLVYYDYFWGKRRPLLADLDKHYRNLRRELINELPNIDAGFRWPKKVELAILNKHFRIIVYLYQWHHLTKEVIVDLLLYSDYYNLHRTYHKLAAYHKGMAKTRFGHGWYAVLEIGNILCPRLEAFRNRRKRTGEARNPCPGMDEYAIEIPITLKNDTTDREVLRYLNNLVGVAIKGVRQAPRTQARPVLGASGKENRLDKPRPDRPKLDITGRYELKGKSHFRCEVGEKQVECFIGETLVINQVGTHFEGYHARLFKPPPTVPDHVQKVVLRIRGDEDEEGDHLTGFYPEERQHAGHTVTIRRKDRKTLKLQWFVFDEPYLEQEYEKISSRSTLLSRDVARAPDLLKYHEWSPLLSKQIATIKNNFSGKGLKKIDRPLKAYWTTSDRNDQRTAAKEIDDLFEEIFYDQNSGIHPSDKDLAANYISFLLTKEDWGPPDNPKLNRYDWLRLMVEQEQVRKAKRGIFHIRRYLNLPDLESDSVPKRFTYKVSIELKGVSGKGGLGAGVLRGTLTIKKTGGEENWPIGKQRSYRAWILGVGAGLGMNFSIEGKGEFEDILEWLPEHFAGWGFLVRGSLTASVYRGKAGGSGFFFIHKRPRGTFQVEFVDTKWGPQKKADKPKVEFQVEEFWMHIGEPDSKDSLDLRATEIQKDYSLEYGKKSSTFNGFDSALVTPDARRLLRIMCASELPWLEQDDVRITVEGHTDRTGPPDYNKGLSENRAANVKLAIRDIMGTKLVIKDDDIKDKGLGESLAASEAGDYDPKENPSYRGVRVLINGRVTLKLDAAFAK